MRPAYDIGREFRCRLQEEASGRRITNEFIEGSDLLQNFRENSLALDGANFRLQGKSPQVMLEEMGTVSIREIASECITDRNGKPIGHSAVLSLFNPHDNAAGTYLGKQMYASRMREAGADVGAMDFTMFQMLMGQLLINSTLQGFQDEEFKFTQLAGTYPTEFITGETVPGVSQPYAADILGVQPNQTAAQEDTLLHKPGTTYNQFAMAENYIVLPATEERGGIISLDRLSVWADRTGLIAQHAADVSRILGVKKEMRGLDMLVGVNNPVSFYQEKYAWDSAQIRLDPYQAGNTVLNNGTYQLSQTYPLRNFPWVNDVDQNPMNDDTAFQRADQFQSKLVNPNTGLPITMGEFPVVLAPYTVRFNIARVLKSFSQWRISQMANLAPGTMVMQGPNIIEDQLGKVNAQVSRLLRQRMILSGMYGDTTGVTTSTIPGATNVFADPVWWYGDFKEAIKYMTNWNIKVTMAPANSEAEFTQGVKFRWRTDERGQWAWFHPRKIQRHNFLNQGILLDFVPAGQI